MSYCVKEFRVHGDSSGSLVASEAFKEVLFAIQRVYYIYGTEQYAVRGRHTHVDLEQLIFCPNGSCDFNIRRWI